MPRDKEKKPKKTRGTKKVRKATKKQRRNKISKSEKPKVEKNKPSTFHFLRTDGFSGRDLETMIV